MKNKHKYLTGAFLVLTLVVASLVISVKNKVSVVFKETIIIELGSEYTVDDVLDFGNRSLK